MVRTVLGIRFAYDTRCTPFLRRYMHLPIQRINKSAETKLNYVQALSTYTRGYFLGMFILGSYVPTPGLPVPVRRVRYMYYTRTANVCVTYTTKVACGTRTPFRSTLYIQKVMCIQNHSKLLYTGMPACIL